MTILRFGIAIVIAWLGYHFGTSITLDNQWPLYDALRNTTSIVFGIMGALLALVYPDAVKNALRGGPAAGANDGGLGRLIVPGAHSALLLIVLVVLAPVISWLATYNPESFPEQVALFRRVSFSLFCVLSYWQVLILLMVLIPFDEMYTKIMQDIARLRLRRDMHRNGRS